MTGAKLSLRRRAFEIVELGRGDNRASRAFDYFLVTLIVLNISAFVAETVPWIAQRHGWWLDKFELFSVGVFTLEYAVRLWTAVEMPFLKRFSPLRARLKAATSPALIIDLLAILPFYLQFLFQIDLRFLRVLRLLRFLKLSRYSPAMHTLLRVISNERRSLIGAGLLLVAALLFSASLMYIIEGSAQPDAFGTVPDAAWWAIATLTTVGYGDVTPVTPLGRFIGGLVMIAGLCILALPVAIIATGFAQEVGRRDFVVNWSLMSRIPLLSELDAREVGQIMPLLHAHNLPPHVEVLPAGAPVGAIYFIASGKVRVADPDSETWLHPGAIFGVDAMLASDVPRAPFITASKCRLLKLHAEDFHRLELINPRVAEQIRARARTVAASPS